MSDAKPSKTELKREQARLKALGAELVELDEAATESLQLDEDLLAAIRDARRMRSKEALRRQKQFIAKQLTVDAADRIQCHLDELRRSSLQEKRRFAQAEQWRDRLLKEGSKALSEFQSATGSSAESIAAIVRELGRTLSDREEKRLRRELFREVHSAMSAN